MKMTEAMNKMDNDTCEIDCSLNEGREFKSYADFETIVQIRKELLGESWSVATGGHTVQSKNKLIDNPALHYPSELKYAYFNLRCAHQEKFISTGAAKKRSKYGRIGSCEAMVKVKACRKKRVLVIWSAVLEHNHEFNAITDCKLNDETQIFISTEPSVSQLKSMVKSVVPELHHGMHKGQAGRIAVIGGCQEYTGAPYFAAISALKVGADLSHVFCTRDAGTVIKSYSPELIVHPILDSSTFLEDMNKWLDRFHVLVIGPGMGREAELLKKVSKLIEIIKSKRLPIIFDADGLFLITEDPTQTVMKLIRDDGDPNVILTPNAIEFERLFKKVCKKDPNPEDTVADVMHLSKELGNITIVLKGAFDIISNGKEVIVCDEPSSARRCGGQGDLLSGSLGTFYHWTQMAKGPDEKRNFLLYQYGDAMCAAYGACCLTRLCNSLAYNDHGRSMTTSDMITRIHTAFNKLFS